MRVLRSRQNLERNDVVVYIPVPVRHGDPGKDRIHKIAMVRIPAQSKQALDISVITTNDHNDNHHDDLYFARAVSSTPW
jgi:hypothetical protein